MKLTMFLVAAACLVGLIVPAVAVASGPDGPDNQYERFRFPWPDGMTPQAVTQTVGQADHTGTLQYSIDWGLPYNTYVPASGQGQVTLVETSWFPPDGFGMHVIQAVSTAAGTRYILYGHLCSIGSASVGATLYQGEYVGRSGNTGSSFDQNGNPPSVRCSTSDTRGMHIHFMFDNTSPESNSWAFGQTTPDDVALHSATTASLPQSHTDYSGNTPPGAQSDLSLDSYIRNSYVARFGLNYGSTKALNPSTFSICGVSSRWVVGCDFTYFGHSTGIAQTFESPEGYQKALMRRSGFTSVYSVQRDILYAYHSWSSFLGFPTGDESGTTAVTQFFEGGYIQKTQSPCATSVYNNSGVLQQSFSGICN